MHKLYGSCHQGTQMSVLKDFQVAFNSLQKDLDDAHVIVDAVDECPKEGNEREYLLAMTNQLRNSFPKSLRLLATSKREYDIETAFDSLLTIPAICIESSQVDSDINLYIQSELEIIGERKNWSDDLKAEIENALVQ